MSTARTDALARVAKLVPSLGRDNDAEVLATVRAIGRALQGAGLDFHDLAGALGHQPAPAASLDPFRGAEPFRQKPKRSSPNRAEEARAYAFGDATTRTPPGHVDRTVSLALLHEVEPRAAELSTADFQTFHNARVALGAGRPLNRVQHALLHDLVAKLRRTP